MARRSRFQTGAVWFAALSLLVTVGTGHSVGVAYSLPEIAPTALAAGGRGAGATTSGDWEATRAEQVGPPVTLVTQSPLLLLRDVPIQLQMQESVNLRATQPGALLATKQSAANQRLDMWSGGNSATH